MSNSLSETAKAVNTSPYTIDPYYTREGITRHKAAIILKAGGVGGI
jgi:hypothetical protein